MDSIIHQFDIENDLDVVLANKRAVQIASLCGLPVSDQTRFATAVSEVGRNCIQQVNSGRITFKLTEIDKCPMLVAQVKDTGPSRQRKAHPDMDRNKSRNGSGLVNSRKIVDYFEIVGSEDETHVILGKKLTAKHPPLNNLIIKGWSKHFETQKESISPYEEIKNRNIQLIEYADELKKRKMEVDLQMEEIKRLNAMLERKNENLIQVAYTLAHDLKNPLNTIKLSSELGLASSVEEKDQFFSMIKRNSERLNEIINGLQNTIDQDPDIALEGDKIDLREVAYDCEEQFRTHLEKVKGNLLFNFEGDPFITYPKVYLLSILSNLISNSIKYASDKKLKIKVQGKHVTNGYELTIKDNGIGMDTGENGVNIFKAFTRVHDIQTEDLGLSKGLGLSIVYHLVTKNGGNIEVKSKPGEGAIFICNLAEYTNTNPIHDNRS